MLTTVALGRVYNFSHAVGYSAAEGPGFQFPAALAIGQGGVVYVFSRGNETNYGSRLSKLTIGDPGDEEVQSEFGKPGEGDGQLLWATSIALDRAGNVYVADEWLQRISIFDSDGTFLDKWGIPGTGDGELNWPSGMAFDRDDNLYIVNIANSRVQKFTKDGTFLAKFGEEGSSEGQFNLPWSITIDSQGDIYIADWKNHRVQKFSSGGTFVTSFGTFGTGLGELNHPTDVAVDDHGDVYVCDRSNHLVQIFAPDGDVITSLYGDAQVLSKLGQQKVDANQDMIRLRRMVKSLEPEWRFYHPTAVVFDDVTRRIIVADCQRSRLQIYLKGTDFVAPQFNL